MLVIGDFGLSWDQSRVQFALWSIWSAPLYMSNDLRSLRPEMKAILQNKKVIAINQDKFGIMGKRRHQVINSKVLIDFSIFKKLSFPIKNKNGDFEVWVKPVTPVVSDVHSYAIVYFNRNQIGGPTNVMYAKTVK